MQNISSPEMIIDEFDVDEKSDWIDKAASLGDSAVDYLIKATKDREDANRRGAAAIALGRIGDSHALMPLIDMLSDQEVSAAAAEALGDLGDSRAIKPLIPVLEASGSGQRVGAAYALGVIGDLSAVEPLISRLRDEKDWVRKVAVKALSNIALRDKTIGLRLIKILKYERVQIPVIPAT